MEHVNDAMQSVLQKTLNDVQALVKPSSLSIGE